MKPIPSEQTELGKAILEMVRESPGIYTSDLAASIGRNTDSVRVKCYRLKAEKQLIGLPSDKPRQWFPKWWIPPQQPTPEPEPFRMPPAPLLF